MKIDVTLFADDLKTIGATAAQIEALGAACLWTAEAAHNPFLPLVLAAEHTQTLQLGTQIAVAFARSPMTVAQIAWDIATQSDGRFILGLGTQVKAHIQRRFSMEWGDPVGRMREYVEALRAIWNTWQTGAPLRYQGQHYNFTLMTPFFSPAPMPYHQIPVYVAGVNEKICVMAGEVCDGLHAHGFHTQRYLREVVLPAVEVGLATRGRSRQDFELVVPLFVVTGRTDEALEKSIIETKGRIAFYASTPTYASVLELHGWQDIGAKLSQMARTNQWESMWREVSDEMLNEIAIVAKPEGLADAIRARYTGLADRLCLGWDTGFIENADLLQSVSALREG